MGNSYAPFLYQDQAAKPGTKIFGVAGGSLNSAGFDARSTQAGIDGERRIGKVLDEFASKNANVFAFHSVKLPGHFGDVDHVLVVGSTIFVIDAKNWKSDASYTVGDDGATIYRNGDTFPGGKVSVGRYVGEFRTFTSRYKLDVRGLLVVSNSKSKTERNPNSEWDFVNLAVLREVIYEEVRAQRRASALSASGVAEIASRVVNPDYDGEWESVVHAERAKDGGTQYTAAPSQSSSASLLSRLGGFAAFVAWGVVMVSMSATYFFAPERSREIFDVPWYVLSLFAFASLAFVIWRKVTGRSLGRRKMIFIVMFSIVVLTAQLVMIPSVSDFLNSGQLRL